MFVAAVGIAILTAPIATLAQHHNLTHDQPAVANATVGWGVAPPVGGNGTTLDATDPSCLVVGQSAAFPTGTRLVAIADIGGPNDPCSYKNHHMTPEETTILKDGEVRFEAHGGGHGFAIYEVSKDTTREDIGNFLCAGFDRSLPAAQHPCETGIGSAGVGALNAAAAHNVADGKGDVVLMVNTNPPDAQVLSAPGRLSLNNAFANNAFMTYRFLKTGRYIVFCTTRSHFLNDWMFAFVNVVGGGN